MLADYVARHVPEPVICLGERLLNYSLGHDILLARFGNAFVIGGKPKITDLLTGIFVCSNRYEVGLKKITEGRHLTWAAEFKERFKEKQFNFNEEVEFFAEYVLEAKRQPKVWVKEGTERQIGSPLISRLKLFNMEKLNMRETEALNRGYALTYYEFCVWLEENEALSIYSEADAEAKKLADKFKRKHGL